MPKKSKEVLSADAKAKVKERTEDLLDDDTDVEFDDSGLLLQNEPSKSDHRMIMRRRLEDYLEDRQLQKELGDDFDI